MRADQAALQLLASLDGDVPGCQAPKPVEMPYAGTSDAASSSIRARVAARASTAPSARRTAAPCRATATTSSSLSAEPSSTTASTFDPSTMAPSKPTGAAAPYAAPMPAFDLPLDELQTYSPLRPAPADLTASGTRRWRSLAPQRPAPCSNRSTRGSPVPRTYDVTFSGFGGDPVKAWLHLPSGASGPLPTVVQYVGYGGGRGLAHEAGAWSLSGRAHLVVDTRGQGSGWSVGDTPDPHGSGPSAPGFLTSGVLDPHTLLLPAGLYRRGARSRCVARAAGGGRGPGRAGGRKPGWRHRPGRARRSVKSSSR